MLCASFDIDFKVQHIRGYNNVIAESLSHGIYECLGEVTWEVRPHNFILFFRSPPCYKTNVTTAH